MIPYTHAIMGHSIKGIVNILLWAGLGILCTQSLRVPGWLSLPLGLALGFGLHRGLLILSVILGKLLLKRGTHRGAVLSFSLAIWLWPTATTLTYRGQAYASLRKRSRSHDDLNRALADLDHALVLDPQFTKGYLQRALVYRQLSEHHSAIADLDQVLSLDPDQILAYHYRGSLHLKRKDFNAAIRDYSLYLDQDPRSASAYLGRAQAFAQQKHWPEAKADLDRALALDPRSSSTLITRGQINREIKDYPASIADLSRAIELDPQSPIAHTQRGVSYYHWGELQQMRRDLDWAVELEAQPGYSLYVRALHRHYCGDQGGAVEDMSRLIDQDPSADNHYTRGVIHAFMGNYRKAIEDLTLTLEEQPDHLAALYCRGNAHQALGMGRAASADHHQANQLQSAQKIQSHDEHGHYHRAVVLYQQGDQQGAWADLQQAQAICLQVKNSRLLRQVVGLINRIEMSQQRPLMGQGR